MTNKEALNLLMKNQKKVRDGQTFINLNTNEIETIEECNEIIKQDLDRLEKLEKVIEDIKQLPKCEVCDGNWIKGCMCFRKKLKEVLENDK